MKLIVGLGNPGKEYNNTRHNIGFMVLDRIADKNNVQFSHNKFKSEYAMFEKYGEKIILLKPQTYMNLSGEAVSAIVNFYKIPVEDILVISDDLDMEIGKIKLKLKGSSGGHNGLKNIEFHLHTQEYKRLKIGISKEHNSDVKDYVLGKFSSEQMDKINCILDMANCIIDDFCTLTFENVMSKYNKK